MTAAHLTEWCRIPTSGARAVEPFELDGTAFLAIPQMSYDRDGTPPGMNGGDSDTDMLILRRDGVGYAPVSNVAGARRRRRRVLPHRGSGLPRDREHPQRKGPLRVQHRLGHLRVERLEVRVLPAHPELRGEAVAPLHARRPAFPRARAGYRSARCGGTQRAVADLRMERNVVRAVPGDRIEVGVQLVPDVRRRFRLPCSRRPHHAVAPLPMGWNAVRRAPRPGRSGRSSVCNVRCGRGRLSPRRLYS